MDAINGAMDRQGEGGLAQALADLFARHGYQRAEPSVLQPVEPFLEVSGEDIRKRLFVTQDADGAEWCLRPEFTIPVCRDHLARHGAAALDHFYVGPVFRMRPGGSGEFLQAGIESIGRSDREAADAEALALCAEATELGGLTDPLILLGDVAVLQGFVRGLGLPQVEARRLMRAVAGGRGAEAASVLQAPDAPQSSAHAGLLAAIEGQDPTAARRFVEDVLSIAGISRVGGRSASDIAERFLARAGEKATGTSEEARAAIARLLAISGEPDAAAAELRALAGELGIDVAAELDALESRFGFMAALGLDLGRMRFEASFARNLDYYTSFIFELRSADPSQPKPAAGGGRYDLLMGRLGAAEEIPAVGGSIWLERLPGPTP